MNGYSYLVSMINKQISEPVSRNGRKLDCATIRWCRMQVKSGMKASALASELKISSATLSRALKGKTYAECK